MSGLHEAAGALLNELDGHEYPTHKVIDSARIRDARNALRAALAADDGRVSVPMEIIDRFPEINPSNYDHDDVCALNAWGVELVLAAR